MFFTHRRKILKGDYSQSPHFPVEKLNAGGKRATPRYYGNRHSCFSQEGGEIKRSYDLEIGAVRLEGWLDHSLTMYY